MLLYQKTLIGGNVKNACKDGKPSVLYDMECEKGEFVGKKYQLCVSLQKRESFILYCLLSEHFWECCFFAIMVHGYMPRYNRSSDANLEWRLADRRLQLVRR